MAKAATVRHLRKLRIVGVKMRMKNFLTGPVGEFKANSGYTIVLESRMNAITENMTHFYTSNDLFPRLIEYPSTGEYHLLPRIDAERSVRVMYHDGCYNIFQ